MPFETGATPSLDLSEDLPHAVGAHDYAFEGHVDFYGYHAELQGWFFGGWIAHPWPVGNRPQTATAHFAQGALDDHALSVFHYRADVERRGIGFVFFLRGAARAVGPLQRLALRFTRSRHDVPPTDNVQMLPEPALVAELHGILAGGEDGSQRRKMLDLLQRGSVAASVGGFIDCYGYHAAAGGWLFCGWVSQGWAEGQQPTRIVASFDENEIGGEAEAALYPRHDLKDDAAGAMFFVQGSGAPLGGLCSISYEAGGVRFTQFPAQTVQRLREADLVARLRPTLLPAPPDPGRDALLALLARKPYAGQDTLAALHNLVFLEIDEAIVCEPDGLVLIGWCLSKPGAIRDMRIRCGSRSVGFDLHQAIRIERPDVVAALGPEHGFDETRCGFVAYVAQAVQPDETIYIEIETRRREIGFRGVPQPKLGGMAAIRRLLDCVDVRFEDLPPAFDRVLGPAVQALSRSRLKQRPTSVVVEYGTVPAEPACSVVVPLYGRLDFVEYQLALLSAHPAACEAEIIYVLDEPSRRTEAQRLFAAAYAAFGLPFRAVLLDRNVGFAPASNIGLSHARGEYVAFVNSDVFPGTPDWLERLAGRLAADPALGVVGPVLLFDDGSVQHQGMHFVRLREFGDWFFPQHGGKGLRAAASGGLRPCLSLTGACMMLRRELAVAVGGFDESYVVGDFEDSDLCLKLQALGYGCAVDHEVRLYHLERKSQASSALGWRMNLTLYNAWQHQRRWAATLAAHLAGHGPSLAADAT